jgi:four helix bundle protein
VTLEEWEKSVPEAITSDALWRVTAYRLALFVADLAWQDTTALVRDRRTLGLSGQLYDAIGSVGANIAEGYSRGSARDRCRFYEYALGSARESRDWYYKGRHVLGDAIVTHRIQLLTRVTQLLLKMLPQQRGFAVHEAGAPYGIECSGVEEEWPLQPEG